MDSLDLGLKVREIGSMRIEHKGDSTLLGLEMEEVGHVARNTDSS